MYPAKLVDDMTKSHNKLVFLDKESADRKDLMNSIGRFDEENGELALLDQSDGAIQKIRALYSSGVRPRLMHSGKNYYLATEWSTLDALSESVEHIPLYHYKYGEKTLVGAVQEFDDYYDIEFDADFVPPEKYEIEEKDGELVLEDAIQKAQKDKGVIAQQKKSEKRAKETLDLVKVRNESNVAKRSKNLIEQALWEMNQWN
ncbi:TPA: hypothetical protein NG675_004973 [Vibrio parahaemolyticus]|nr:hypothetical protein [Vibrio parahaemolyticus]HCE2814414.1 hypothetical protein [Vibrio parahaemolyticus]HCE2818709.1 hypothetical protein [Vibrio parahaemolyticus]HCG5303164.1 hypothetical protein [Vibrio parahaemolyticus]HCG5307357.1 hypothetical protein [Vibrio parahaemolyticus]